MVYAKKSFGQNFLKDKKALEKIVGAAKLDETQTVLEIGPGRGALTKGLLETGASVIAVEKDPEMVQVLEEKFPEEISTKKLILHTGDILEQDIQTFGLTDQGFKVVANIPYYITGAILRTMLQSDIQPTDMVLLVQKEVAERIMADVGKNPKESILSISVKAYGAPKYIATVGAKSFSPAPKVDSAIIAIQGISKELFSENNVTEENFFTLIKQGFSQKRKTLLNNLKNGGCEPVKTKEIFQKLDINEKIRAEDLNTIDWFSLSQKINL